MCSFLGLPGNYGESFLFNGGAATLDSYGVTEREPARGAAAASPTRISISSNAWPPAICARRTSSSTPASCRRSSSRSSASRTCSGFARNLFSARIKLGSTVVFGHTPMRAVMVDLPYKLGIDTGLVYGGKLTCIEFTEGVLYQVSRGQPSGKNQRHRAQLRPASLRGFERSRLFYARAAPANVDGSVAT